MSRTTRTGGVVLVLLGLVAGVARADGSVSVCGDRATVIGRLGEHGVVVVNDALAFVLRDEGLGFIRAGSWVRASGRVLPGARLEGRRALLRLNYDAIEVIAVEEDTTAKVVGGMGIADRINGSIDDPELERLHAIARRSRDQAAIDELMRHVMSCPPEVRRRWMSRLAELGARLPAEVDPVDALRAAVTAALADGVLTRVEYDACRTAWGPVAADPDASERAGRWLGSGSAAHEAIYAGLHGDLPFEAVARMLDRDDRVAPAKGPRDARPMALVGPARTPPPVLGALDAGTAAGRACNELWKELEDSLDELKAAVRERVRALNAQRSLTREQVEEIHDLRQAAASTAAFGAVDAVLTEEGGKASTAWQASRCAGGRSRVYANYRALGGA